MLTHQIRLIVSSRYGVKRAFSLRATCLESPHASAPSFSRWPQGGGREYPSPPEEPWLVPGGTCRACGSPLDIRGFSRARRAERVGRQHLQAGGRPRRRRQGPLRATGSRPFRPARAGQQGGHLACNSRSALATSRRGPRCECPVCHFPPGTRERTGPPSLRAIVASLRSPAACLDLPYPAGDAALESREALDAADDGIRIEAATHQSQESRSSLT